MNIGQIGKRLPGWLEHVVACAGPRPVGWFLTETASHGVHRDIVYGCLQCFGRVDISIISRSYLPEAKAVLAGPLAHGKPTKQRTLNCHEEVEDVEQLHTGSARDGSY